MLAGGADCIFLLLLLLLLLLFTLRTRPEPLRGWLFKGVAAPVRVDELVVGCCERDGGEKEREDGLGW